MSQFGRWHISQSGKSRLNFLYSNRIEEKRRKKSVIAMSIDDTIVIGKKWFKKFSFKHNFRNMFIFFDVSWEWSLTYEIPITCFSFGTLMTATLEWEGIPAYVIGIARGISAVIGIAATVAYPLLQSRISIIRTGLWSIWSQVQTHKWLQKCSLCISDMLWVFVTYSTSFPCLNNYAKDMLMYVLLCMQWTCLLPCVATIWIQNGILSSYILMGSVAISRLGLWMFDLSVLQQMQARNNPCWLKLFQLFPKEFF